MALIPPERSAQASTEAGEVCPVQAAPRRTGLQTGASQNLPTFTPVKKEAFPHMADPPRGLFPPEETLKRNASSKEKTDAYRREDGVSVFIL